MYGSVRGVPGNWYPYRDRRQSSETTNMSVSDRLRSILEIFSGDGLWVLARNRRSITYLLGNVTNNVLPKHP